MFTQNPPTIDAHLKVRKLQSRCVSEKYMDLKNAHYTEMRASRSHSFKGELFVQGWCSAPKGAVT